MASVPNHWAPKVLLSLLIGRDELTKRSDLDKSTAVLPAFDLLIRNMLTCICAMVTKTYALSGYIHGLT